jgi:hypothetical protein
MKRPEDFKDWTLGEYVVAGIALLVCLVNLLR